MGFSIYTLRRKMINLYQMGIYAIEITVFALLLYDSSMGL